MLKHCFKEFPDNLQRRFVAKLSSSKAENVITSQFQVTVRCCHSPVEPWSGSARIVGIMLLAIDLQHDANTPRQEHQEIHSESEKSIPPTFPHRLRVPMQPHLGKKGGKRRYRSLETPEIRLKKKVLRGRIVRQTSKKPAIERVLGLFVISEAVQIGPPGLQIAPGYSFRTYRSIIYQHFIQ